jgi:hypothetical protein
MLLSHRPCILHRSSCPHAFQRQAASRHQLFRRTHLAAETNRQQGEPEPIDVDFEDSDDEGTSAPRSEILLEFGLVEPSQSVNDRSSQLLGGAGILHVAAVITFLSTWAAVTSYQT